jgi:manganese oxidase
MSLFSRCVACLTILISGALVQASGQAPASPRAIRANDNRAPAGSLQNGILTLHLELTSGDWYPEADSGPSMKVDALAEEGKPPQIPGPLLRVPQGTEIHATFHNLLSATAVIHGMHQHPGDAKDVLEVPSGQTRELRFVAGDPGTYQYFASAGGEINRGRPFRDDSQMYGAFIVDPPGVMPKDRVFVIGFWRSELLATRSNDVGVINGKSWPYTERLTYAAGDEVRWRWINASDVNHPMHLHGSFYTVQSIGDGERDRMLAPAEQLTGVTHLLHFGSTMTTLWSPVAGRWLFHCHFNAHVAPERAVANAYAPTDNVIHEHGANHMAGLVLGITVTGERPEVAPQGRTRHLRLLVRERSAANGQPAGFGYQLQESHRLVPADVPASGPPLILERGRPVEITVVNQLHEPTAVHWHGMELESYYDGVPGWGARGSELTPAIEPGKSFHVRFIPPRAGTFIYHTHMDDEIQLAGGLYGPLVVLQPGATYNPNTDHLFVIGLHGGRRSGDPKRPATLSINGAEQPAALQWHTGRRYRLRLINITSASVGSFSISGPDGLTKWRAVGKDGADLPTSQSVTRDAFQEIAPGETYDFDFAPDKPGTLTVRFETVVGPKITQQIEIE